MYIIYNYIAGQIVRYKTYLMQTDGFLKRCEGPPVARFKRGPFDVYLMHLFIVVCTIQARYIHTIQTSGFLKRGKGPPRVKRGPFNVLTNASAERHHIIQVHLHYIQ